MTDLRWGWPAIRDSDGKFDHRARREPITCCRCLACLAAMALYRLPSVKAADMREDDL